MAKVRVKLLLAVLTGALLLVSARAWEPNEQSQLLGLYQTGQQSQPLSLVSPGKKNQPMSSVLFFVKCFKTWTNVYSLCFYLSSITEIASSNVCIISVLTATVED